MAAIPLEFKKTIKTQSKQSAQQKFDFDGHRTTTNRTSQIVRCLEVNQNSPERLIHPWATALLQGTDHALAFPSLPAALPRELHLCFAGAKTIVWVSERTDQGGKLYPNLPCDVSKSPANRRCLHAAVGGHAGNCAERRIWWRHNYELGHLPVGDVDVDGVAIIEQAAHVCHGRMQQPVPVAEAPPLLAAGKGARILQRPRLCQLAADQTPYIPSAA